MNFLSLFHSPPSLREHTFNATYLALPQDCSKAAFLIPDGYAKSACPTMDDVRGNPSLFEQVHKDVTRRCPQESAHDLQAAPRSPHTTPRAHHRQRHAGSWDIIPTAATHVAQPSSPDQAAETATAPQHVKAWDVRVAWRDAELFHMSRREGRLTIVTPVLDRGREPNVDVRSVVHGNDVRSDPRELWKGKRSRSVSGAEKPEAR